MIRTLTLAAVAAALLVAPASAQSIRVSTAGKTTAQVRAEIAAAARKVCSDIPAGPLMMETYASCRRAAVAGAMAQLTTASTEAPAKVAQR